MDAPGTWLLPCMWSRSVVPVSEHLGGLAAPGLTGCVTNESLSRVLQGHLFSRPSLADRETGASHTRVAPLSGSLPCPSFSFSPSHVLGSFLFPLACCPCPSSSFHSFRHHGALPTVACRGQRQEPHPVERAGQRDQLLAPSSAAWLPGCPSKTTSEPAKTKGSLSPPGAPTLPPGDASLGRSWAFSLEPMIGDLR